MNNNYNINKYPWNIGAIKISFLIFMFFIIFTPQRTNADAMPSQFDRGGNIYSGEETNVEMTSEKVVFSNLRYEDGDLIADVYIDFYMTNLGDQKEDMALIFPFYFAKNMLERQNKPGVFDVEIYVNDKKIDHQEDWEKLEVHFNTTFYPQKTTKINVSYKQIGSPMYYSSNKSFEYILHTGAKWKNSIGHGDIIVELPYKATKDNISIKSINNNNPPSRGLYDIRHILDNNKLIYSFDNFEPTKNDDIYIEVVNVEAIKTINNLKEKAEDNPSYEVYMELAEIYKNKIQNSSENYFYNIEKALQYKYSDKSLGYYKEAMSLYSNNFKLIPDGRFFNFFTNLDKVYELRDELVENKAINNEDKKETLLKTNYTLFRDMLMCPTAYYCGFNPAHYSKDTQKSKYTDELIREKMGEKFNYDDNFKIMINTIIDRGYVAWDKDMETMFYQSQQGDYSFLNDGNNKADDEKMGSNETPEQGEEPNKNTSNIDNSTNPSKGLVLADKFINHSENKYPIMVILVLVILMMIIGTIYLKLKK